MSDVLASYAPGAAYDEMIDGTGQVRSPYTELHNTLGRAQPAELRSIAETLSNNYFQAGVTFDVGGVERPFPLDLVPRVIASPEWEIIEAGVAQRVPPSRLSCHTVRRGPVITDRRDPAQLVILSTHYQRPGASSRTTTFGSMFRRRSVRPTGTSGAGDNVRCERVLVLMRTEGAMSPDADASATKTSARWPATRNSCWRRLRAGEPAGSTTPVGCADH